MSYGGGKLSGANMSEGGMSPGERPTVDDMATLQCRS